MGVKRSEYQEEKMVQINLSNKNPPVKGENCENLSKVT